MESMEQACSEIVRIRKIPQATDDEDVKELVRQCLSSNAAGKWLLIVDNADDINLLFGGGQQVQGIADHLPQSKIGLVLFTTRYQEVATQIWYSRQPSPTVTSPRSYMLVFFNASSTLSTLMLGLDLASIETSDGAPSRK